jgi:hypothetical protein
MHDIEPFYKWRDDYNSAEDDLSPFYGKEYSEFEFSETIYNFYIHPQWDFFGSPTLYLKIIFADYDKNFAIIEFIGEWNDCITNDIMFLKREIMELLVAQGINKFILLGENILNFHCSDDCYYEEWFQEIEEGWIAAINFREHVIEEFKRANIDYYISFGGDFDDFNWRNLKPQQLFDLIDATMTKRLA